ncbi:MAG TPA: hypothetical protein VFN67_01240 [Polyangiales bacterium]|nr:hypothetical protein [Polyangiales bacterium]
MSMDAAEDVMEDRLWKKAGWIARVIKNEDDEGWAVAMTRIGDDEPALVGPWTMGRDKKNPKPLDAGAFATLVKTANEILMRHEQAERARMHKSLSIISDDEQRIRVDLDIARDEDDPHAVLTAYEADSGELLRTTRVMPNFKLTQTSARRFVKSGET